MTGLRCFLFCLQTTAFLFTSHAYAVGTYNSLRVVANCHTGDDVSVRVLYEVHSQQLLLQSSQGTQPIETLSSDKDAVTYSTPNVTLKLARVPTNGSQAAAFSVHGGTSPQQDQRLICESDPDLTPALAARHAAQAGN